MRANEVTKCVREEDFVAMYSAIGDKDRQDNIRLSHPDANHCRWLKKHPNSCDCLPGGFGFEEKYVGKPCPNNPYETHSDVFEALEDRADLLNPAFYLGDLAELGMLPPVDKLLPQEFITARIMKQHTRMRELQMQQAGTASMMFGTKDKKS